MSQKTFRLPDLGEGLTEAEIVQIVDLEIAKLDTRLKDKDMAIELTSAAAWRRCRTAVPTLPVAPRTTILTASGPP